LYLGWGTLTSIYAFRCSGGTAVWGRGADGSQAVGAGRRPRRREPGRASGLPWQDSVVNELSACPTGRAVVHRGHKGPKVRMGGLTCTLAGIFPIGFCFSPGGLMHISTAKPGWSPVRLTTAKLFDNLKRTAVSGPKDAAVRPTSVDLERRELPSAEIRGSRARSRDVARGKATT
jgi:hypothetical protein